MPVKKPPRVPEFRLHKATGQGYVVLNGQAVYLGRWDRPETEQRYHLLIATWLAAGGKRPPEPCLTARLSCVRVANVRAHGQETADGPVDGFQEDGVVAQAAGAVRARPDVGRGVLCPPARVDGCVPLPAGQDRQAGKPRVRAEAPQRRAISRESTPARAYGRIGRPVFLHRCTRSTAARGNGRIGWPTCLGRCRRSLDRCTRSIPARGNGCTGPPLSALARDRSRRRPASLFQPLTVPDAGPARGQGQSIRPWAAAQPEKKLPHRRRVPRFRRVRPPGLAEGLR